MMTTVDRGIGIALLAIIAVCIGIVVVHAAFDEPDTHWVEYVDAEAFNVLYVRPVGCRPEWLCRRPIRILARDVDPPPDADVGRRYVDEWAEESGTLTITRPRRYGCGWIATIRDRWGNNLADGDREKK